MVRFTNSYPRVNYIELWNYFLSVSSTGGQFIFQIPPETPRRCLHCHPAHVSTPSNYAQHLVQYYTHSNFTNRQNGIYTPQQSSYHGGELYSFFSWHKSLHAVFNQLDLITTIVLTTKSFHFFSLDDFTHSKLFFSISNFRPCMVFDSGRFIDYSVRKIFKCFPSHFALLRK